MANTSQPPEPPPLPIAFGPPLLGCFMKLSIDYMKKEEPDKYQLVIKLCKMALTHYQKIHAEEAYEFVNLEEVSTTVVEYNLTFCARKCDDNTVATFGAVGRNFPGQELSIAICNKKEIDMQDQSNMRKHQQLR